MVIMIDWAINIEPLYPGMDICDKIEKVAAAGFNAIEFWGWQEKDITKIRETCEKKRSACTRLLRHGKVLSVRQGAYRGYGRMD